MPIYAHVVEAEPAKVWQALLDPARRARHHRFLKDAESEMGKVGTLGHVARYRSRFLGSWRERLVELDPSHRAVFEELDPGRDSIRARFEWRLEPVKLGTHVVLDVRPANPVAWAGAKFVWKYRHRRLVAAVKRAVEGWPDSIVDEFPTMAEWEALRDAAQEAPADGKGEGAAAGDPAGSGSAGKGPKPPKPPKTPASSRGKRKTKAKPAPATTKGSSPRRTR